VTEAVKLTAYAGERDRVDGAFVADALLDLFARHGLGLAVLLRGVLGFGLRHHLRSDRLLTLSEDLPVVAIAVDERARVEAVLPDVRRLLAKGLVTLERATLATAPLQAAPAPGGDATRLTLYLGRKHESGGRPAYEVAVACLRRHGVAGATVLLGVDGILHGARQRAAFFGRNADVPLEVLAVGESDAIAAALAELEGLLARPLATVERIRVVKRDGVRVGDLHAVVTPDASGLDVWLKLSVFASEASLHGGRPLHEGLVRALREAGAAGATSVRGIWGYHGDHEPHGDRLLAVRRRVPVVTVVVDVPERIRALLPIVDELTAETGLVTSELVPAFRAVGGGERRGGLRLASPAGPAQ
jgi:PII-like signaling protein